MVSTTRKRAAHRAISVSERWTEKQLNYQQKIPTVLSFGAVGILFYSGSQKKTCYYSLYRWTQKKCGEKSDRNVGENPRKKFGGDVARWYFCIKEILNF